MDRSRERRSQILWIPVCLRRTTIMVSCMSNISSIMDSIQDLRYCCGAEEKKPSKVLFTSQHRCRRWVGPFQHNLLPGNGDSSGDRNKRLGGSGWWGGERSPVLSHGKGKSLGGRPQQCRPPAPSRGECKIVATGQHWAHTRSRVQGNGVTGGPESVRDGWEAKKTNLTSKVLTA